MQGGNGFEKSHECESDEQSVIVEQNVVCMRIGPYKYRPISGRQVREFNKKEQEDQSTVCSLVVFRTT